MRLLDPLLTPTSSPIIDRSVQLSVSIECWSNSKQQTAIRGEHLCANRPKGKHLFRHNRVKCCIMLDLWSWAFGYCYEWSVSPDAVDIFELHLFDDAIFSCGRRLARRKREIFTISLPNQHPSNWLVINSMEHVLFCSPPSSIQCIHKIFGIVHGKERKWLAPERPLHFRGAFIWVSIELAGDCMHIELISPYFMYDSVVCWT